MGMWVYKLWSLDSLITTIPAYGDEISVEVNLKVSFLKSTVGSDKIIRELDVLVK
jgi:hypothetical protein